MFSRVLPSEFDHMIRTRSGMEVILIDPILAKHILEHYNTRNRRISADRVEFLTREFREGRYIFTTSQAIVFTASHTLANGQHRLAAIVRANMVLPMAVIFNEPDDALKIIDQVKVRLSHETIALFSPLKSVTLHHIAVLKAMIRGAAYVEPRLSPTDIEQRLRQHWNAITFSIEALPKRKPHVKTVRSEIRAVIARASYSHDHQKLREFCNVLSSGIATNQGCPAALLFRYIYSCGTGEGRVTRSETYRKTERALWAHLKNERLSRLMCANEELFPLPEERLE